MDTQSALERVRRFVGAMTDVPRVDEALPALRRLLDAAGLSYKLVGGVAVVHHGYVRTTDDLDVLVPADALSKLSALLGAHGFVPETPRRLRHAATGVAVDLLVAGEPLARSGAGSYPSPDEVGGSDTDPSVADLPALVLLKLRSARHQDMADVCALLKLQDDVAYTVLESQLEGTFRSKLAELRRDALEELSWER